MINLREWIDSNTKRPLVIATATILFIQTGYLVYLTHSEYSTQIRKIERMVETVSLGMQQDNRPLVEATLIAGLQNADVAKVALCRGPTVSLIYPPSGDNPCLTTFRHFFQWTVRRNAIGMAEYEFIFIINAPKTFASLAVLVIITVILLVLLVLILARARKRFESDILEPLYNGLNKEAALGITELDILRRRNREYIELSHKQSIAKAAFEIAAQVAHDIKSPLSALDSALPSLSKLPEDQRILVRSAVSRIKDIANDLLDKNRAKERMSDGAHERMSERKNETSHSLTLTHSHAHTPSLEVYLLSSLIEPLITEKRLQFRAKSGIEIDSQLGPDSYGLFAKIEPTEFKRILSNLTNNSVEALDGKGSVVVSMKEATQATEVKEVKEVEDHAIFFNPATPITSFTPITSPANVLIQIKDTGKGIPPEILSKLGTRGETHGKPQGSGLGLYHARISVERWAGSLEIVSELGKGTTVVIQLPKAQAPDWFVSELNITPESTVVILDDDPSIHQVWKNRLKVKEVKEVKEARGNIEANEENIQILHFYKPAELRQWIKEKGRGEGVEGRGLGVETKRNEHSSVSFPSTPYPQPPTLFLMDYELLGFKETGLDLIEELNLASHATCGERSRTILVTSRYEEQPILERCQRLGIRLIPKGLAGFVPIRIEGERGERGERGDRGGKAESPDAVLIDDDPLVHLTWKMSAKRAGRTLLAFHSTQEFLTQAPTLNPTIPIYIDSHLGNGIKGEEQAKRIFDLGFKTIYVVTGYEPEKFSHLSYIKGVLGKEPPWVDKSVSFKES